MANFIFNVALGRVAALYQNVDLNTPAGCELVVAILQSTGLETDAVLRDKTTMADVVSGTTNEATNAGYAQKVLVAADITYTVDQANDRVDLDLPDQTWTGVAAAGGAWGKLIVLYDAAGTGVAANMIPLTAHDFVVTPDGSDVVAVINAAGFYRATSTA